MKWGIKLSSVCTKMNCEHLIAEERPDNFFLYLECAACGLSIKHRTLSVFLILSPNASSKCIHLDYIKKLEKLRKM